MSERKLFAYLVVEKMPTGQVLEHEIFAPNDAVALEFKRSELMGELVSFCRIKKEAYILDYTDISENSEDTEWDLKYITVNLKN